MRESYQWTCEDFLRENSCFTSKVAIVWTGFVGMSFAYSLFIQEISSEIVLIDINKKKAKGEAMDLNHGMSFVKPSRI